MKQLFAALVFLAAFATRPLLGCKCVGTSSVCDAFATANVVFVGKVESKYPSFDPEDPAISARLEQLDQGGSTEALAKAKAFYAQVLPEPQRSEVAKTTNGAQLEAAVNKIVAEGQRVTFRVDQAYKGLKKGNQFVDVWSEYTDCGIRFLKGETYVVYAWTGKNGLRTGACSRTRRISEAGDDLVYLHFMQSGALDAGRIWGFISGDERATSVPHSFDSVPLPMTNLEVQLSSSLGTLQAWTNQDGRFVFDGLPAGDYEIELPADKRNVHLKAKACKSEWFYLPRDKRSK